MKFKKQIKKTNKSKSVSLMIINELMMITNSRRDYSNACNIKTIDIIFP